MRIDNIRITMSRYHPIILLTSQCTRSSLHGGRIDVEGVKILFHGPERKSRHGKKLLRLFHRPRQQQYLPSLLFFILLSDLLLHHNITISRDRTGHHYLFHHSFVPGSSVRQYLGDISFVSSISRLSGMMSLVFPLFASRCSILAFELCPTTPGTPCPHHGLSPEIRVSTGSTSECSLWPRISAQQTRISSFCKRSGTTRRSAMNDAVFSFAT